MASRTARGVGAPCESSGLVTLTLPPPARLTVGTPLMVTLGVLPTVTVGALPMFTVLPAARPTVPVTVVVPWAVVGTGCPEVLTTRTF